jgi:hypothetical protein
MSWLVSFLSFELSLSYFGFVRNQIMTNRICVRNRGTNPLSATSENRVFCLALKLSFERDQAPVQFRFEVKMNHIFTLTLLGMVVAGCSSQPNVDTSVTQAAQSNPDIANIAPEGRFTEEIPTSETDSHLPVMTPNAPPIILTAIQGNNTTSSTPDSLSTENWQTFTSSALGVSLEYPSDWSVVEEADGVVFASPSGTTIQMKADSSSVNNNEIKIGNQYCTSRTNAHQLTAEVCADMISFIYTAKFTLPNANGSTRRLTLSTTSRSNGEVFEAMFNSVQLTS